MEETIAKPRYQILSGSTLKLIALIVMLIDHIGAVLLEPGVIAAYNAGTVDISYNMALFCYYVDVCFRTVGRIAFPIYCFLLAEGFTHTRDVKKYGTRLLLFALISEIPFDLAFYRSWFYVGHQNVFFTLFLGLVALWFLRRYEGCVWKQAAAVLICCGAAWLLKTDYDAYGVALISLMYVIRRLPGASRIIATAIALTYEGVTIYYLYLSEMLALIPISMYNGEKGRKWNKYLFYGFYPVHLIVLTLICRIIFG